MPLPPGVARWTLYGPLTAEERWAFDWWTMPGTGVADSTAWQATTDAMWTALVGIGLHTQVATLLPAAGGVEGVSSLYYRNSQTATFAASHPGNFITAGTSTSVAPLQTSLCVSLLTPIPGRSTRGRLYLPATGASLDTNRRFTTTQINPVISALKTIINAGRTDGQYGPPVVVSKTHTLATPITQLRWDQRPDIQRRRANRQSVGVRTVVTL